MLSVTYNKVHFMKSTHAWTGRQSQILLKQVMVQHVMCIECASVCTGHSCWGILNGPATGKALAELICHGESHCVDLAPYDPARLIDKSEGIRQKERMINYERTHLADLEPSA